MHSGFRCVKPHPLGMTATPAPLLASAGWLTHLEGEASGGSPCPLAGSGPGFALPVCPLAAGASFVPRLGLQPCLTSGSPGLPPAQGSHPGPDKRGRGSGVPGPACGFCRHTPSPSTCWDWKCRDGLPGSLGCQGAWEVALRGRGPSSFVTEVSLSLGPGSPPGLQVRCPAEVKASPQACPLPSWPLPQGLPLGQ